MSIPSAAAQVIVSIIPIVGIVMGSVVVFFYLLWNHREKTRLIEKGLYQPRPFDPAAFSLLSGLLLSAVGLVLTLIFLLLEGFSYSVLGGAIPLSIGLSLLGFYSFWKRTELP